MKNIDNLTVVTSIPECYKHQDFFETTCLFIDSVRRYHPNIPILVIVPENYVHPLLDEVTFISTTLDDCELLMSNVVLYAQSYINTSHFIYFTTENILLNPLYNIDDNIHVTITPIQEGNTYYEFERTMHQMYTGSINDNSNMVLEYVIAGKTNDVFWSKFNKLSINILKWIRDNQEEIYKKYTKELFKYILPAADLVSLNILYDKSFKNIPHSFISMHPGLSEKFVKPAPDSIFYQYSGLTHDNINKFKYIIQDNTKCWLYINCMKNNYIINELLTSCKKTIS